MRKFSVEEIEELVEELNLEDIENITNVFDGGDHYDEIFDYYQFCCNLAPKNGLWMEFGVYKARTLLEIAKYTTDTVYGFDSFEGLPEEWVKSSDRILPKGCFNDINIPDILHKINGKNVCLVKGMFQDTLSTFLSKNQETASLIHIDCDLYSSTKYVLDTLVQHNRIVSGTIIMFDELIGYENFKTHEFKALCEFTLPFDYIAKAKYQAAIRIF